MTTNDGSVIGTTLVIDNGPPARRWNLVILGDGYIQTDLGTYATDVQNFINTLQITRPFNDFWNAINIYRVDVVSTDSGADDPTACGGTGATPATYFDASFCGDGTNQRALVVDNATATTVANQQVPEWDMIMVIVNSAIYGGTGGNIAVFSTAANANEIGMHEMGHTAFKLADEYESRAGCDSGETGHDTYTGGEPTEHPNVTIDTNIVTNKWRNLILASTPMPTTSNSNCTQCDPQPSPVLQGTVGTFEGAHTYHCGIYRPEFNCRMRSLNNPFCAVCEQIISQRLSLYLDTTVPDVLEGRAAGAAAIVRDWGLVPVFAGESGPDAWVFRQEPHPGVVVQRGSTVTLYLRTGPIP
jgi:IgA Peptidase M64